MIHSKTTSRFHGEEKKYSFWHKKKYRIIQSTLSNDQSRRIEYYVRFVFGNGDEQIYTSTICNHSF